MAGTLAFFSGPETMSWPCTAPANRKRQGVNRRKVTVISRESARDGGPCEKDDTARRRRPQGRRLSAFRRRCVTEILLDTRRAEPQYWRPLPCDGNHLGRSPSSVNRVVIR